MVAEHLGVSTSTVSLALRGNPSISAETREKVLRGAKALGYHPDPEISKLMSHLRVGWKPGFKSAIHAFTTRQENQFSEYHEDLVNGARQRAEELGYGFALKRFDPSTVNTRALQRTLVSQGIEGILLLPMLTPLACDRLLDWSCFSVVSATYGVSSPEFHRVVPHQFSNIRVACEELAALGFRRIGLIQRRAFSAMVNHSFVAAMTTQNFLGPTEPVAPFLFTENLTEGLKEWFARERPDALVVEGEPTYKIVAKELGLSSRDKIGVALSNRERASTFPGIDEHGLAVGRTAIDTLAFKIQTGDKGIPTDPVVTMIKGKWVPGIQPLRKFTRPPIGKPASQA
jgi:DNA-binding LacI/PurR family transcriptional regulator